ncbi:MAG: hypothetical protein HQL41_09340 [Alphaproteobacteria bacterium]|nr:hypothetical protein [Alphaproteobacteria bacterium]
MPRLAALVAVLMLVSPAVRAAGLEPGGLALRLLDSPDARRFDVSPLAALSFGPVVGESFQPFGDRLAVGGFVRMNFASWSVGAAVSRLDERPGAELEIGLEDGETEYLLRLGAGWSGESSLDAAEASMDDGIDLSLTVNHALSPDIFVGGMAGAGRDRTSGDEPGRFRFGAGLGLRF